MKKIFLLTLLVIFIGCNEDESTVNITILTNPLIEITRTTATSGGEINNDSNSEIISKGICWNVLGNPTISDNITNDGTGNIEFVSYLTGLTPNINYYIRAYVTYENGTVYGNERQFTTLDDGTIASINTIDVLNIMQTIAMCGGNIINDGNNEITEKGICWSINSNPTVNDNFTNEGIGNENFTSMLVNLIRNTTYFVRAYAINSKGIAYGNQKQFTTQDIFLMETVNVPGGTFIMGNNNGFNSSQQPEHEVTVNSFTMSKYEITNAQFAVFLNEINANPDGSFGGVEYIRLIFSNVQVKFVNGQFQAETEKENYPVTHVTWYGAKAFSTYYGGRLPTEAEWEYAAKGGVNTNNYIYSGSDLINDIAWYFYNSHNSDNDMIGGKGTHIVGTRDANELGLHDMSGNVNEWVNDYWDSNYYSISPSSNPQGPISHPYDVGILRGGGWIHLPSDTEVTVRQNLDHTLGGYVDGFRPVF